MARLERRHQSKLFGYGLKVPVSGGRACRPRRRRRGRSGRRKPPLPVLAGRLDHVVGTGEAGVACDRLGTADDAKRGRPVEQRRQASARVAGLTQRLPCANDAISARGLHGRSPGGRLYRSRVEADSPFLTIGALRRGCYVRRLRKALRILPAFKARRRLVIVDPAGSAIKLRSCTIRNAAQ